MNEKCIVCGEPAFPLGKGDQPVCLGVACQQVLANKKRMGAFAYHNYFQFQSRHIRLRNEQLRIENAILEKKRKAEQKAYADRVKTRFMRLNGITVEGFGILFPSRNRAATEAVNGARKALLEKYLTGLVQDCFADMEMEAFCGDSDPSRYDTINDACVGEDAVCAFCAGKCCFLGVKNAFIDQETIRRYRSYQPKASPVQIIHAYLSYIPDRSYENSCIYHTQTGCCLPRNMRADICVSWRCVTLNRLRECFTEAPTYEGVLLVERMQYGWQDAFDRDADYLPAITSIVNCESRTSFN